MIHQELLEEAEDAHLADSERYMIGGRDTVLVVWILCSVAVVAFLILAP